MNANAENPEATEEEQEQAHEGRQSEEDAMRGPAHEDPGDAEEQGQGR
jgi:hypothetical protein